MTEPAPEVEPELEVVPDEPGDPLSAVSQDAARQWNPALWSSQLPYSGRP
jgi:hypothetical protein